MDGKEPKKQFHIKCPNCKEEFIQDSMIVPQHFNKAKTLLYCEGTQPLCPGSRHGGIIIP
jgi:hypothetical protein